jgi:hypothetical protein
MTDDNYNPLEPMTHIIKSEEPWPSFVIEFKAPPEAPGFQEMAVTELDWFDNSPDVIILQSRTDVRVYQTADGRVVHLYRSPQAQQVTE